MEKKPIIEFKDFSFKYKIQSKATLHDINLTIYEGEKVLILGPSGCGKSTLLKSIFWEYSLKNFQRIIVKFALFFSSITSL